MNINNLPRTDYINNGSKFIVNNNDGTFLIDYENVIINVDQITFTDDINKNNAFITTLSALHDSNMVLLFDLAYAPFDAASMSVLAVSGSLSGYNSMVYSTFSGSDVPIPLNYIEVNTFSDQTNSTNKDQANTLSIATSSIVIPSGTYRLKTAATFIASLNSDYQDAMWAFMKVVRNTPPSRDLLKSNVCYTHGWAANPFNLFINGFFYTCGDTEISIRVSTLGMVSIGHEAISAPSTAPAYYIRRRGSIKDIFGYTTIRPIQLTLERLSTGNTLSAII